MYCVLTVKKCSNFSVKGKFFFFVALYCEFHNTRSQQTDFPDMVLGVDMERKHDNK